MHSFVNISVCICVRICICIWLCSLIVTKWAILMHRFVFVFLWDLLLVFEIYTVYVFIHICLVFVLYDIIILKKAWATGPLRSCLCCFHPGDGPHRKSHDTQVKTYLSSRDKKKQDHPPSIFPPKACTLGGGWEADILGDGRFHLPLHVLLRSGHLHLSFGPNG